MMLYTIIPMDVVMQHANEVAGYEDHVVNGVTCTLERIEGNLYRLVRVWSTDPAIYLNPEYQPGKMIKL